MKKRYVLQVSLLLSLLCLSFNLEAVDFGNDQAYDKLSSTLVTPHIPFANPYYKGKIKILVIAPTWTQRETVEFAQRLSLDYTPLMTHSYENFGPYEKTYAVEMQISGKQFTAIVRERLSKEAQYDLIIIGKMKWGTFPESIQKMILEKVRQGTGLIYISQSVLDTEIKNFLKDDAKVKDFIVNDVPLKCLPLLRDIPKNQLILSGKIGEGRVISIYYGRSKSSSSHKPECLTPFDSDDPLFYDYYYSLLAKASLWAAKKEPDVYFGNLKVENNVIKREKLPETKVTFSLKGRSSSIENCSIAYVVRDRKNQVEYRKSKSCHAGENSFTLPLLKGGGKILDIWVKQQDGKIVNWASIPFLVIPPVQIKEISLDKDFYERGEVLSGKIVLSQPVSENTILKTEIWDNFGRKIISSVHTPNGKEAMFTHQIQDPLTYACRVNAKIIAGGELIDEKDSAFYINITDISKMTKSFHFTMHRGGFDARANSRSISTYLSQIYDSGVDSIYVPPSREAALCLVRENLQSNLYSVFLPMVTSPFLNAVSGPDGPEIRGCYLSESTEERTKTNRKIKQIRQAAHACAPFGPVYNLGEEARISKPYMDVCFCKKCQHGFRRYLEEVYVTIKALNDEWSTDYTNWDDIKPITLVDAYKLNRYPHWVDFRLYMDKMYTQLHIDCVKAVHEIDTDAIVGLNAPYCALESAGGFIWYRLLPHMRYFIPYWYPSVIYKIAFSFLPRDSISGVWYGAYGGKTHEQYMRYVPWDVLFKGMNSCGWFAIGNISGLGSHAALTPDYTLLGNYRQTAKEIREIKLGIGDLLLTAAKEIHPIGVYFSNSCLHAVTIRPEKKNYEETLAGFDCIIRDAGYEYRYISPDDIASGRLKNYKVLILPYSQAISISEVDRMKEFVKNGGILIADFDPGVMDEHGRMLEKSSLLDVFGEFSPFNINSYGKGKAVYLADYVKGYQSKRKGGGSKDVCDRFRRLIRELAGIEPFGYVEDTEGVMRQDIAIASFKSGNASFVTLIRNFHIKDSKSPLVKVKLPVSSYIYDIRGKKFLGYGNEISTSLSPAQAKVFALLPSQIEKLELKLDKEEYERGQKVRFNVGLYPLTLKDCGLGVRIDVFGPDGQCIPYYTRKVLSSNCRFNGAIPLSLNESPGIYKVVATNIVSGQKVTKTFRVP